MIKLRYGNTNTFYIQGADGGLLLDTDWAGTLQPFFKAIKASGVEMKAIKALLITHYHPDHMGLAGELQQRGVKLLLADVQRPFVHAADEIFARDRRLSYRAADENAASGQDADMQQDQAAEQYEKPADEGYSEQYSEENSWYEEETASDSYAAGICTLCRKNCSLSAPQCDKPYEFGLL